MNRLPDEMAAEFLAEFERNPQALRLYLQRYPAFRSDLIGMAVYSSVTGGVTGKAGDLADEELPEPHSDEYQLAKRMADRMRRLATSGASSAQLEGSSILGVARALGLPSRRLARHLRIGLTVLTKLDRRLLDPTTIPDRLVTQLADALQVSVEAVRTYLNLEPTLSPRAAYRAARAPSLESAMEQAALMPSISEPDLSYASEVREEAKPYALAQQTFSEALSSAPDMTDEDKAVWLAEGNA